ncbi:MAG: phosphatidate cytidylyltransferase [Anaerolineae bacterium]|nr:phosphatidate cytidylyltransferase [Anaerolineae bacterium]
MTNNQFVNRLVASFIMIPLFVIPIYFGGWVLVLGLIYLLIQGLHEYFSIIQEKQKSYTILGYLIGTAIILFAYLSPENIAIAIGLGAMGFILVRVIGPEFDFSRWVAVFLGALYLGLFLSYAVSIRQLPDGREWLFAVLFGGSATDVFSYLIGNKFGRTKLAPRTSPNKTWEGFAGGVIGSVVIVTALCQAFQLTNIYWSIFLGVIIAFADLLGDLFESMIKRTYGVKDSGTWLVKDAHGGALDRIDGWLIVMPVSYMFITYFLM